MQTLIELIRSESRQLSSFTRAGLIPMPSFSSSFLRYKEAENLFCDSLEIVYFLIDVSQFGNILSSFPYPLKDANESMNLETGNKVG